MNYPKKSKVNVAVSKNHDFDLSRQVVTTHDFGRVKPIECRYMVPGDKFNYRVSSFTRLLPMVSPTFGKIDTIQRAYFVPIRSMFPKIYDWLSNQPIPAYDGTWSTDTIIPHCTMYDFVQAFLGNSALTVKLPDQESYDPGEYDIYCNYIAGTVHSIADNTFVAITTPDYYKFTSEGRKFYDFLVSLGLNISFEYSYRSVKVSLLPLLAFWKSYIDWVVPSRFIKDYPVNIKYVLQYLSSDEYGQSGLSDFHSNYAAAKWFSDNLVHYPLSFYENDYFNSAWLYPFNEQSMADSLIIPNPSNGNGNALVNPVMFDADVDSEDPTLNNGPTFTYGGDFMNYFTIQSLGRLQEYLNRGMLAGSKVQDWLLTEFGIRPSTDALNLSTYIGKISDTIRIGDVTSMADTAQSNPNRGQLLGAYAGKATGGSSGKFSYAAREHGFFIITTEIVPKTSYTQGLSPEFSMIDRFDFFEGAFDNMGVQAISRKELFCSPRKYDITSQMDPEKIFGFAPRYANLKCSFDTLSGDFRTRYGEYLKSWYLNRDVEKFLVDSDKLGDGVIDLQFATVNSDLQNWSNIFSYVDDDIDHFYQIFVIENSASRPMLSIADALNPEHPNGNKEVTIKTHGGVE